MLSYTRTVTEGQSRKMFGMRGMMPLRLRPIEAVLMFQLIPFSSDFFLQGQAQPLPTVGGPQIARRIATVSRDSGIGTENLQRRLGTTDGLRQLVAWPRLLMDDVTKGSGLGVIRETHTGTSGRLVSHK